MENCGRCVWTLCRPADWCWPCKTTVNINSSLPLFIHADFTWQVFAKNWEKHEQQSINRAARPVPKQNWPEYRQFLALKGGCCRKQLEKRSSIKAEHKVPNLFSWSICSGFLCKITACWLKAVMQIPGLNIPELQCLSLLSMPSPWAYNIFCMLFNDRGPQCFHGHADGPFLLGLCWSQPDGTGRMDGQHWGKVLCSSREGKRQAVSLLHHVCLTPFSQWRQWFSSLNAWNAMEREGVCVCQRERSVCPQKHARLYLQVNINNTFCHRGMFVMAKRWREFNAAAAVLLGKAAGQHFTTCHRSLPKRHRATNI